MPRRTTILLNEDIYRRLAEESLKRYGSAKAVSKVINDLLKTALKNQYVVDILNLIFSERATKISAKEFKEFRRDLSRRLHS